MKAAIKAHLFAYWPQWLAAVEIFLIESMIGFISGWSSPYLAKLSRPDSTLLITKEEASWIASLINISRPLGAIMGSALVYLMGSKTSTWISGIPFALSWTCFFITKTVTLIFVSRILSGIGMGMLYSTFPLYMGEISSPKIRGALVGFVMQSCITGSLLGNIMGTYLDLWAFAAICLVPNLAFLFLFFIMPATPHFLVRHNKFDEAAKSIKWYDRSADVASELESLKKFLLSNKTSSFCDSVRDLNIDINRKTMLRVGIMFFLTQFSGLYAISAYMEIIFESLRVKVIKPASLVIFCSIIGIIASLITLYTNDKYGRKIMLTISSFGIAFSMILWGVHYLLLDWGYNDPNLQWLTIFSAINYQINLAMGIITVPTTIMSEMFAPNVKSFGACMCNIVSAVFAFASTKSYQSMVDTLSEKYVFWIYSSIMIALALYTILFIPETKGKSLAEIQEMLAANIAVKKLSVPNININRLSDTKEKLDNC